MQLFRNFEWGKAHGSQKPTGGSKPDQLSARTLYIGETIGVELKIVKRIAGGFGVAKPIDWADSEDESLRSETPSEAEQPAQATCLPPNPQHRHTLQSF